jgi:hypothetical protein
MGWRPLTRAAFDDAGGLQPTKQSGTACDACPVRLAFGLPDPQHRGCTIEENAGSASMPGESDLRLPFAVALTEGCHIAAFRTV